VALASLRRELWGSADQVLGLVHPPQNSIYRTANCTPALWWSILLAFVLTLSYKMYGRVVDIDFCTFRTSRTPATPAPQRNRYFTSTYIHCGPSYTVYEDTQWISNVHQRCTGISTVVPHTLCMRIHSGYPDTYVRTD
jgi:hypothetical protein